MIEREDVDGIAVVRLAHGKVNALDIELCRAIAETFRELSDGPARAVVFTGTGRAFCAGVDLWRLVEGGPAYVQEYVPALVEAFTAVFDCGKPVIAALNGHAIAGGCVLACCCDHRLMAAGGARVGIPELLVGVPFPAAALLIVEHAVGEVTGRRAALTGEVYPAERAVALRFVDELVEPDRLGEVALALARRTADAVPADTYRLTKRQMHEETTARIARLAAAYDAGATELWRRRAADGWIAAYMTRVTGRDSVTG